MLNNKVNFTVLFVYANPGINFNFQERFGPPIIKHVVF